MQVCTCELLVLVQEGLTGMGKWRGWSPIPHRYVALELQVDFPLTTHPPQPHTWLDHLLSIFFSLNSKWFRDIHKLENL
jgi:hypothetical protein